MKLKALGLSIQMVLVLFIWSSTASVCGCIWNSISSHANISCGLPQGSIQGHLLFLFYVNDMSGAVSNQLLLYADDSAILVADKCASNIEHILQNELEIVSEWLVDNKLSLHLGKTECILFGSRPRLKSQSVLCITCKGTAIEAKNTVKYLGVMLEQCLSGASLATSVIQKSNARLEKGDFFFIWQPKRF